MTKQLFAQLDDLTAELLVGGRKTNDVTKFINPAGNERGWEDDGTGTGGEVFIEPVEGEDPWFADYQATL